jgi:hypothetical protein
VILSQCCALPIALGGQVELVYPLTVTVCFTVATCLVGSADRGTVMVWLTYILKCRVRQPIVLADAVLVKLTVHNSTSSPIIFVWR